MCENNNQECNNINEVVVNKPIENETLDYEQSLRDEITNLERQLKATEKDRDIAKYENLIFLGMCENLRKAENLTKESVDKEIKDALLEVSKHFLEVNK